VTCIKLGPIGDTGYLARHDRVRDALIGRMGGRVLTADEALQAVESLLATKAPAVGLVDLDFGVLGRFLPAASAPKFSSLAFDDGRRGRVSELTHDPQRLAALPPAELLPALRDLVRGEIAQILRLPPEQIDASTSLFDIGMDSLMAVELSLSLETRIGVKFSALALSDAPTIERIAARIAQQLQPGDETGADAGNGASGADSLAEQVRLVAERHASEVSDEQTRKVTEELSDSSAPMPLTCGRHS
jgi:acyl carrier protein